MKRNKIITFSCLLIIIALGIIFYPRLIGKAPFAKLDVSDVSSAAVRLIPPDKTAQVIDIKDLVDALNEVVIYEKDASYNKHAGQSVTYTITLSDGKEMIVGANNPFVIIDGVAYKAKYKPCEKLSQIANELIE